MAECCWSRAERSATSALSSATSVRRVLTSVCRAWQPGHSGFGVLIGSRYGSEGKRVTPVNSYPWQRFRKQEERRA